MTNHQTHGESAEPLAYVGAAMALGFGALGVVLAWDRMAAMTQVLVLAAAALVLAAASLITPVRLPAFGRVADVSASTGAVLAGWAAGLATHTLGATVPLALAVGALVGALAAGVAHLRRHGTLPHVVAGTGVVGAAVWLGVDFGAEAAIAGTIAIAVGLGWWALGLAEVVVPVRAAVVGAGLNVIGGAAITLAAEEAWPLLAVVVATLLFAGAALRDLEPVAHRALATATGLLAVAKAGLLIDDPALRLVVVGLAIGVALVVAATTIARRSRPTVDGGEPSPQQG